MTYTSSEGKAIYLKNLKNSLNMTDSDANLEQLEKQAEAFAKSIEEILPKLIVEVPAFGLASPPGIAGGPVTGSAVGTVS